MRLTRGTSGNTGRQREVERAYEDLTGQFKPFWQIAVELYDRFGTQRLVRDEVERRYGVPISEKTASLWINRGLQERTDHLLAVAAGEVA